MPETERVCGNCAAWTGERCLLGFKPSPFSLLWPKVRTLCSAVHHVRPGDQVGRYRAELEQWRNKHYDLWAISRDALAELEGQGG